MSTPQQLEMCEKQSEVTVADTKVMAAPAQMGMEGTHEAEEKAKDAADVDVGDLRPYCACIFCIESLYCKCPNCFGCNSNGEVLCIKNECTGCKMVKPSENEDGACCIWSKGGCLLIKPRTLCQGDATQFCFDTRCALPPTKDVPALVNILGLNLVGGKGCCKTMAVLNPEKYGKK